MSKSLNIEEELRGRRILIVEDDSGFAQRLQNVFDRYGSDVNIKCTVESGLTELKKNGLTYDIIIVDVMLPATEADYDKIGEIRRKLDECIEILIDAEDASPDSEKFEEIEKARKNRQYLSALILPLIRKAGGIEMIERWVDNLAEKKHPPILYLTALEEITSKQSGLQAARVKNVGWTTKPVSVNKLTEEVVSLISNCSLESEY